MWCLFLAVKPCVDFVLDSWLNFPPVLCHQNSDENNNKIQLQLLFIVKKIYKVISKQIYIKPLEQRIYQRFFNDATSQNKWKDWVR